MPQKITATITPQEFKDLFAKEIGTPDDGIDDGVLNNEK